jgi:hypothetical protein
MPFNSHTASLAGKKSKRGKSKIAPNIQDKLDLLAAENLDYFLSLLDELTNAERIKLTQIILNYTTPKSGTRPANSFLQEDKDEPFIIEIIDREKQEKED